MQISVSGQSMDIGTALNEYVKDRIERSVTKYFKDAIFGNVVFSKQGHLFTAKIYVNEGTKTGIKIKAEGKSGDVHAAFDGAADRIEKQLRRYHRYITNHKQKERYENKLIDATQSIIQASKDDEESEPADAPIIIAEQAETIETMSVSEAVLRMDMASVPAYMFINSGSGRINVVYKREDGNISWMDPKASEARLAS
ncbi:MAG: ribosome-associated translation inhibitor RaiA [Rickettsiales bacterium]|nr:ribosome-associated translation inhibitor RaiA [Rickettsiales bacterium]